MSADMTQFTARETHTLPASLRILQKKGLTVTCPDRTPITDMEHILKQRLSAHQTREPINGNVVSITSGEPKKVLYTLGTENLTVARFTKLISRYKISTVVDCRPEPPAADDAIARAFPALYHREGKLPGNKRVVNPGGIGGMMSRFDNAAQNVLLLGYEEAPGDCHRYCVIARQLLKRGVDAMNIFGPDLYLTSELQRSITDGDESVAV